MKTASRQNVAYGGTRSSVFLPAIIIFLSSFMSATALELTSINEGWQFIPDNTSIQEQVNLPHTWNGDAYTTRDYHRGAGIIPAKFSYPDARGAKEFISILTEPHQSQPSRLTGLPQAAIQGHIHHIPST